MNTDRQGLDSLPVCVMENTGTRRTLQWQKNVNLCREFRILAGIAGKEFYSVKTIVCVDNRMGICFNGRRVSRDRMVSEDILEMTRGNVLWMAPEADKLFKEVFKAKEEVCREIGTGKKIQDAGRLEDEKMWKVDRNFLEKKRISVLLRGRIWLDMRGRLQRLFCINGTGIIRQMYFLR